jgi:hypothetical protein
MFTYHRYDFDLMTEGRVTETLTGRMLIINLRRRVLVLYLLRAGDHWSIQHEWITPL